MQRLQKAKLTWGETRKPIFTNQTLYKKTRILLWDALVRSTITYAIHTQEYTVREAKKLEQFQPKCLRQIQNEQWYINAENHHTRKYTKHETTNHTDMATKAGNNTTSKTNNNKLENTHHGTTKYPEARRKMETTMATA